MSFDTQKGRLSLLGTNDVRNGTPSNWADRLLAMLEEGDFVGAIRLASSYYEGREDSQSIGLPEHDETRREAVGGTLLELMTASLKYAFGQNEPQDDSQLADLASACVDAALIMKHSQFLFDEVFAWYDDNAQAPILLDVLEPYIRCRKIVSIPPTIMKPLLDHLVKAHPPAQLEEIIYCLDMRSIDIDQITGLCKRYRLYNAYIYVWTRALGDYVSPIEELLRLSCLPTQPNGHTEHADQPQDNTTAVFPYLSFTLAGRVYPTGRQLEHEESEKAKGRVYDFFFSSTLDRSFRISAEAAASQSFPQLRKLLLLDAASSMSVLNEAFEDSYLNVPDTFGVDADEIASSADKAPWKGITRQFIINVLLEIMSSNILDDEDSIFLDMFVARSVAKYPQDIVLSGSTLNNILTRLCRPPSEDVADDCQLSVEYLFSVYHPPEMQSFIPLLREAKFFRVLKSIYRSENQWPPLVEAYFLDKQEQDGVFEVVRACLGKYSTANLHQKQQVRDLLKTHARDLAEINIAHTAALAASVFPESLDFFLVILQDNKLLQYRYLKCLFEPPGRTAALVPSEASLLGQYIRLMCQQDSQRVADYVDSLTDLNLQSEDVLPAMEASGTIDAAVVLLARQGQINDAMTQLVKKMNSLEAALSETLDKMEIKTDDLSQGETVGQLLAMIRKYFGVGIWLCRRQTNAAKQSRPANRSTRRSNALASKLSFEEDLWLRLIHSVVSTTRAFPHPDISTGAASGMKADELADIVTSLRAVAQDVFTALLQATTASGTGSGDETNVSFLNILRTFLTDAAATSPSLAELRAAIRSIFSAYAYEESLLALANSMLDKDLFVHVDEIAKLRRRGWRPRGQVCEICRRRVWGPGASASIWEDWSRKEARGTQKRLGHEPTATDENMKATPGKSRATTELPTSGSLRAESIDGPRSLTDAQVGPAVVFACRHVFHKSCLDQRRTNASGKGPVSSSRTDPEARCLTCHTLE